MLVWQGVFWGIYLPSSGQGFFIFPFLHSPQSLSSASSQLKLAVLLRTQTPAAIPSSEKLSIQVRILTVSVSALEPHSVFNSSKLPYAEKHTSWNGCVHIIMPARCLHAHRKPPSGAPDSSPWKKKKSHLNSLLSKPQCWPFLLSELPVEKMHLQSDHASPGSVCKGYSNGYTIWITLHFQCACLIILQNLSVLCFKVCILWRLVHLPSQVKIVDLWAVLQFLPALSEGHNLTTSVTETCFGVSSEILLFKNIS